MSWRRAGTLTGLFTLVESSLPMRAAVCQTPAFSLRRSLGVHEDRSFGSRKAQLSVSEHFTSIVAVSM